MATNPLDPGPLLKAMAEALPTHAQGDTTSNLSSSFEAIALFAHGCMANLGFRLLGFNEDQKIEPECQRLAPRLPSRWNNGFSSYSFVYAHTQSSMQYVLRIDRMGGRAQIRGMAIGADQIYTAEITARDYVSSAALPLRITMTPEGTEDRSDLQQKLRSVFVSEDQIKQLADKLKTTVIQRLIPGLYKEGYEEDPDARAARQDADQAGRSGARQPPPQMPDPLPQPARPYPLDDPLAIAPRRPRPAADFPPPDFEDEYEVNRPPRGPLAMPGQAPHAPFGGIGHNDLYPPGLGPNDPLRPSFTGGGGFGGGLRAPGFGGGMHPTFDDPLFQGPGQGGQGGQGFDPQAPPGARWDPTGPGGVPRFGGNRPGGRGGGGGYGGFGGGFGGDII